MQRRTSTGFTNPLSSGFEDNELYFLYFGVPAKPGIAKDLIEPDDISRKAVAYFIELKGASLVSMAFFLLDIMLTLR